MSYNAYITRIKNIRKHTNADRLQVGECFGNFVIVSLDTQDNELGVYFPTDGRLGIEFCEFNNLLRKKDELGNQVGGYLDAEKRNITSLKLRGEKSDGLFLSLSSLEKFTDISKLKSGDNITFLDGTLICEKYVPKRNPRSTQQSSTGKKVKKESFESYPYFEEHIDTSQLAYNTHQFKEGDVCSISLKLHGTSARSTYSIKEQIKSLPKPLYMITKLLGIKMKPKRSWENISGTRRVILKNFDNGFYGTDQFRKQYHDYFVGKLYKGETIYYEIVGYVNENTLIMPECKNSKTKDKEFIKQYGETTRFTYGCEVGQSDIYVYRMTMTNEDGFSVEYSPTQLSIRCEQMGVKVCPELDRFIFTTIEDLNERVNKYADGIDPVGKNHIREGVVVRIENSDRFKVFKHKNFSFKVLEGIIKSDDVLDMEEADGTN